MKMSRTKPYSDVEYVQQRRPDLELDIRRNHADLNLYDLNTFLRAIVPSLKHLIQIIEVQCHVHPQFQVLVARLHSLNARCQRPICQGRILSETRFARDCNPLSFPVAHPPFIYELESLLSARDSERLVQTYLTHLMRYLDVDGPIENDSCLLCLTFDLYATDQTNLKNFRLFFLENICPVSREHDTIDLLYDTDIDVYTKTDQCVMFDKVLDGIRIVCLTQQGQNDCFVRYDDGNRVRLYF